MLGKSMLLDFNSEDLKMGIDLVALAQLDMLKLTHYNP